MKPRRSPNRTSLLLPHTKIKTTGGRLWKSRSRNDVLPDEKALRAFSQIASIIREKVYIDFSYRSAFQAVAIPKRSEGWLLKSHVALDSLDRVFAAATHISLDCKYHFRCAGLMDGVIVPWTSYWLSLVQRHFWSACLLDPSKARKRQLRLARSSRKRFQL